MIYVDFFSAPAAASMRAFNTSRALLLCFLCGLFFLTGCKDDDGSPANPQDSIHGTWVLEGDGYVKRDEVDVSADYAGLTLTFSANGTYTSINGGVLLEASGTWAWQDKGITQLVLDGNQQVFVVGLNDADLHLQFTLDESTPGGRTSSLSGEYDVKLKARK